MLSRIILRTGSIVLVALLVTACVPDVFTRQYLVLKHENIEDIVHLERPLPHCLIKRVVPVLYAVEQPNYTLQLFVTLGAYKDGDNLAKVLIDVKSANGTTSLVVEGKDVKPISLPPGDWGGTLSLSHMSKEIVFPWDNDSMTLSIRDTTGHVLGEEKFIVKRVSCIAMVWDSV